MERYKPQVGIHRDVPINTYHQVWDAYGASQLKALATCPAAFEHALGNPPDNDKDCFRLGNAVDCLVLEPERFAADFAVMDEVSAKGKSRAAKEYREHFIAVAKLEKKTWLRGGENEAAQAMAAAARQSPLYEKCLAGGEAQLSFVFEEQELAFKARPDCWKAGEAGPVMWDVKTTSSKTGGAPGAALLDFSRAVAHYDYLLQAGLYSYAALKVTGGCPRFGFYVIEKESPHLVAAYLLPREVQQAAINYARAMVKELAACVASGQWPALDGEVKTLVLPSWYMSEIQEAK